MNLIYPILLMAVFLSIPAFFIFRQSKAAAAGFSISCLAIAVFCVFGFLASFEPVANGSNLGFKIGYAAIFMAALTGVYRGGRRLLLRAA